MEAIRYSETSGPSGVTGRKLELLRCHATYDDVAGGSFRNTLTVSAAVTTIRVPLKPCPCLQLA
jgi:hypothetical protein